MSKRLNRSDPIYCRKRPKNPLSNDNLCFLVVHILLKGRFYVLSIFTCVVLSNVLISMDNVLINVDRIRPIKLLNWKTSVRLKIWFKMSYKHETQLRLCTLHCVVYTHVTYTIYFDINVQGTIFFKTTSPTQKIDLMSSSLPIVS